MNISDKQKAEIAIIAKNILSGLFPVITILAYQNSLSPLYTLAISSFIATVFFAVLLTRRGEWKDNISQPKTIRDIFLAVVIIAVGYHALYFFALTYTSAANVSLLSLMEVVFSFLIIGFITQKEPVSGRHFGGAFLMLIGAALILFTGQGSWNLGDIAMIAATFIAPIGNIFIKRSLHQVPLTYLMFWRSLGGAIVFFIAALYFENPIGLGVVWGSLRYLLFSGIVFFGLMKIVMLFSVKKTSVTHTLAFHSLKPLFAFLFAWVILKEAPTLNQIVAVVPILAGLFMIMSSKLKATQYKV